MKNESRQRFRSLALIVPAAIFALGGCHKQDEHEGHDHGTQTIAPEAGGSDGHDHGEHAHGDEGKTPAPDTTGDREAEPGHDHGAHAHGDEGETPAPDTTGDHEAEPGHDHGEHAHGDHAHDAVVPAPYAGRTNPLPNDAEAIRQGSAIYTARCVNCHGEKGAGDGRAAPKLDPKPTDFTDRTHLSAMKDDYLFWRTSEGGAMEPFHSKMPAWKDRLSEEERWKVLSYIRTLVK